MGTVTDLAGWKAERGSEAAPGVARLEIALDALEPYLGHPATGGRSVDVETDLLAVAGAVSLEMFDEAADRAERLLARLTERRRNRS